jgi:hypothetical protein
VAAFTVLRFLRRRIDRQELMLDPLLHEPPKEIPRVRLHLDENGYVPTSTVTPEPAHEHDPEELRCEALPERRLIR